MNKKSEELHRIFNSMERLDVNQINSIRFNNGVYIFFEKGETYGNYDRIVRVGTDTGGNNLKSRLRQHFINENKDRSVFRKNIGRAILNSRNDNELLSYWNIDLTGNDNRRKFYDEDKDQKRKLVEKEISKYMKDNMTFVVFELNTKEERLRFEGAIISTLHHDPAFKPSNNWLGRSVPHTRWNFVAECGMWLSQKLNAEEITDDELVKLGQIAKTDIQ